MNAGRRRAAQLAGDAPGRQQQDPAVEDVGYQDFAAGQQHGVVGMIVVAGPRPWHSRMAILARYAAGRDVDHRDRIVLLPRGDDRPAVWGNECVVGMAECLAAPETAGAGELPADPPVRVNEQQALVFLVGDQHVAGQRPRI